MPNFRVTRGYGFLENFLADKRRKMAESLIEPSERGGAILDIGCGAFPRFLLNIKGFNAKYGLDKSVREDLYSRFLENNVFIATCDIEKNTKMPFKDNYFNVITMLAVIEHIPKDRILAVINEIYRILKPGGKYILTTPALWTGPLLSSMAQIRLISPVEIKEHKCAYSHSRIASLLQDANFSKHNLKLGYFEMFMNIWAKAVK